MRATCPNKDRCGASGHYWDGVWKRCPCLEAEIRQRVLGPMYAPEILDKTPLSAQATSNLLMEGPLIVVRKHVARVLLNMRSEGRTWITMDAYRLIEIFLGEDAEHDNQAAATNPDLLILLLGFADPRNKYLPELILQVMARRELSSLPTWVILGVPKGVLSTRYGSELDTKLTTFRPVVFS